MKRTSPESSPAVGWTTTYARISNLLAGNPSSRLILNETYEDRISKEINLRVLTAEALKARGLIDEALFTGIVTSAKAVINANDLPIPEFHRRSLAYNLMEINDNLIGDYKYA